MRARPSPQLRQGREVWCTVPSKSLLGRLIGLAAAVTWLLVGPVVPASADDGTYCVVVNGQAIRCIDY